MGKKRWIWALFCLQCESGLDDRLCLFDYWPDDDNDAIEDVIGVPQILKKAKSGQLQDHLQGEHAGEDDVADFQDVGQLVGLEEDGNRNTEWKQASGKR